MTAPVRFTVEPPPPYALDLTVARFARFPEVVDRVAAGRYRRLLVVAGRPVLLSVRQVGPPARARLAASLSGPTAATAAARAAAQRVIERTLGATTDVRPFYRVFRDDPLLGGAIRARRGLRVAGCRSVWEALVTAVLAQQVNLVFAFSIRRDLALAFGRRARADGETYVAFPAPERIARETPAALRRFRLSGAKAATIHRLAAAFAEGALSDDALEALPDEAVIARLTAIKGIGRWTAETTLMRGLGRLDAFPAGDLGIVKYLAQGLLGHAARAPEATMRAFAERWRPYRALALVYAYAELERRRERR
jgi:DNA-3-methyladenine glycosylase II